MKKTYLDALMSIFTPIPLNNGFYFVDNNGTIDWILSNIFLLGYVLPVEGVMIGIFFYLLLSHAIEHIWGIERSGFFNGREKWAKGFENQRV